MRFDNLDSSYVGCVNTPVSTRTINGQTISSAYFFDGWAWDTNLGYVSFSCQNKKNRGADCGNVNYGAYYGASGSNASNASIVNGFAYNDTAGWISMSCIAGLNNGVPCGSQAYTVRMATASGTGYSCTFKPGDMYGYAWSDSVGWINFCGMHASTSITPVTPIVVDPITIPNAIDTSTQFNDPSNSNIDAATGIKNGLIYANGVQFHDIAITVKENGTPITPVTANRSVVITTAWNDTVRADQITPCSGTGSCTYNATNLNHATATNPSATYEPFPWIQPYNSNAGAYVQQIKSIAPTGSQDTLQLKGLDIKVIDKATNNVIQEFIYDSDSPGLQNKFFQFAPAVSVTKIEGKNVSGSGFTEGVISITGASTNTQVNIWRESHLPSQIATLTMQLYDCSGDYNFAFNPAGSAADRTYSPTVAGICSTVTTAGGITQYLTDSVAANTTSGSISKSIKATAQGTGTITNIDTTGAVQLQTLVNYTYSWNGAPVIVKYFSQRTKEGTVGAQAADVSGNVRIDVRDTTGLPAANKISDSIGEKAQSKRTPFLQAKTAILKAADAVTPPANVSSDKPSYKIITPNDLNLATSTTKGILYYKRDKAQPSPLPCSIILNASSTISFARDVTLVAEGCDVFIDQNIMADTADANKKGHLGIVALQDLTMPQNARKGGNIYICSKVTDIEANIVADGSVLSYGLSQNDCGDPTDKTSRVYGDTGKPIFNDSPRNTLINQLTITGSLVSNNTYGGSLSKNLTLGNGKITTDAEEARLYDINFWRYARMAYDADGNKCWATGVIGSALIDRNSTNPPDCTSNNPDTFSIVNIRYRGPEGTGLPIFSSVKSGS